MHTDEGPCSYGDVHGDLEPEDLTPDLDEAVANYDVEETNKKVSTETSEANE